MKKYIYKIKIMLGVFMSTNLKEFQADILNKISEVKDQKELEDLRVFALGKKGKLTEMMKAMKDLPQEERPAYGQLVNSTREVIETKLTEVKEKFETLMIETKLKSESIDVTEPARKVEAGHKHPMKVVIDEINDIFLGMGYKIAEGPEIEKEYYNFEALNIEKNHPARDEQDTFYIGNEMVLRTQTSPVQVRVMEKQELPIKVICPGRVFRSDAVDATHSPVFHQLEGLVIDENVSMADLKGALAVFAKELLGEHTEVRFRPHHFPFTEPSAEMDVTCFACGGEGCRVCKGEGWIELLGCGMVHPKVLEMSGIDSKKYSGFAFGMGLERITMQKYGITDLRLLFENDIRFLKQF